MDGHERGFTTFRHEWINLLLAEGFAVTCAAPNMTRTTIEDLRARGATAWSTAYNRTTTSPVADGIAILRLAAFLRQQCFDLVMAYGPKTTLIGGLAARMASTPFVPVITGLGHLFDDTPSLVLHTAAKGLKTAYAQAPLAIFQNEDDSTWFVQNGILTARTERYVSAGSGVDLAQYPSTPPVQHHSFLFIGRILRSKGYQEFLDAATTVHQIHPQVTFHMVGWFDSAHPDAPRATDFENSLANSPVIYHGRNANVLPFLQQSSVFVLPSYREGTPRSTLEALSVGRAVISTDVPGCRETVQHGANGFLVPPKDTKGLVEAMLRYLDQPNLIAEHALASRRLAEARFEVHKVNRGILKAVTRVLDS